MLYKFLIIYSLIDISCYFSTKILYDFWTVNNSMLNMRLPGSPDVIGLIYSTLFNSLSKLTIVLYTICFIIILSIQLYKIRNDL